MEYIFELEMQVRDYECDMEGIVNNAIYQHYLEHTRHEFLASSGISFIEMGKEKRRFRSTQERTNMTLSA